MGNANFSGIHLEAEEAENAFRRHPASLLLTPDPRYFQDWLVGEEGEGFRKKSISSTPFSYSSKGTNFGID